MPTNFIQNLNPPDKNNALTKRTVGSFNNHLYVVPLNGRTPVNCKLCQQHECFWGEGLVRWEGGEFSRKWRSLFANLSKWNSRKEITPILLFPPHFHCFKTFTIWTNKKLTCVRCQKFVKISCQNIIIRMTKYDLVNIPENITTSHSY